METSIITLAAYLISAICILRLFQYETHEQNEEQKEAIKLQGTLNSSEEEKYEEEEEKLDHPSALQENTSDDRMKLQQKKHEQSVVVALNDLSAAQVLKLFHHLIEDRGKVTGHLEVQKYGWLYRESAPQLLKMRLADYITELKVGQKRIFILYSASRMKEYWKSTSNQITPYTALLLEKDTDGIMSYQYSDLVFEIPTTLKKILVDLGMDSKRRKLKFTPQHYRRGYCGYAVVFNALIMLDLKSKENFEEFCENQKKWLLEQPVPQVPSVGSMISDSEKQLNKIMETNSQELSEKDLSVKDEEEDFPPKIDKVLIALSGGGLRSCAFAIGALKEVENHAKIEAISSVSGGSYAAASFTLQKFRKVWNDDDYMEEAIKEYYKGRCVGLFVIPLLLNVLLSSWVFVFLSVVGVIAGCWVYLFHSKESFREDFDDKFRRKIGYLVSFNELNGVCHWSIEFVGMSLIVICDVIGFIFFMLFAPFLLTLAVFFPHAVLIANLIKAFQGKYWWWKITNHCVGNLTVLWEIENMPVSSRPILIVIPTIVLVCISIVHTMRQHADAEKFRESNLYDEFSKPEIKENSMPVEGFHFTMKLWRSYVLSILATLISGITSLFPHLTCCSDTIFIFYFLYVFLVMLIAVWNPIEGGVVFVWTAIAFYVHLTLEAWGPDNVQQMKLIRNGTDEFLLSVTKSIEQNWTYHVWLAGFLFILMPLLSRYKNQIANDYYRHRLSILFSTSLLAPQNLKVVLPFKGKNQKLFMFL